MTFSDFVENVIKTPICCELKHNLDKWYEFYSKDHNPELPIGSEKIDFLIILQIFMALYEKESDIYVNY